MAEIIVAMNEKGGIGFKNFLPWKCKEELEVFKQKTIGKTIVVGRKTATFLPKLLDRKIICLSRNINLNTSEWKNDVLLVDKLDKIDYSGGNIIIAGGESIYELAFSHPSLVTKVHMSIIKGDHVFDTSFKMEWLKNFIITEKIEFDEFTHYVLIRTSDGEQQYLDLLKNILLTGEKRYSRNAETISLFKNDMKFDLRNGFPLLTTKKMFLRGIIEEFLFFLRGDTDSTILSEKGIRIWEKNTSEEFITSLGLPYAKGVMGPMYGYQWRFYNSEYTLDNGRPIINNGGIDQLAEVVDLIKNDPTSRRILMTTYNPEQANFGVLYPCHSITIQFYVQNEFLDMFCYNRSQDFLLGVPFNISSSSLLLMIVAKLTNKIPRFFYITMGDSHIYSEHISQVEIQIKRMPFAFPTLQIPDIKDLKEIDSLTAKDFILVDYNFHPQIKAEMVA
jgi:thymidylate synthase